jgi:hypothetical protein
MEHVYGTKLKDERKETVKEKDRHHKHHHKNKRESAGKASVVTTYGAERTATFYDDYKYLMTKAKPFNIQNFESLGWPFPFQEESPLPPFRIPKKAERLVYDQSRYTADSSPSLICIPSRKMMITMMRACIEVENVNELWIY